MADEPLERHAAGEPTPFGMTFAKGQIEAVADYVREHPYGVRVEEQGQGYFTAILLDAEGVELDRQIIHPLQFGG